jgi:hypothetical protein
MYNLVWQSVICRPGKLLILLVTKNQMLRPTAPAARRRWSAWGKRAAGDGLSRVGAKGFSLAPLTEPDMRARIRLFGLIDQSASVSWADTCGWLISFHRAVSVAIRSVNQDGG